ncbi:hypothetical protein I4U23_016258 [Adineta vaga]|nr:hypothetical protein I4U23_016258 [Adineta vaga]
MDDNDFHLVQYQKLKVLVMVLRFPSESDRYIPFFNKQILYLMNSEEKRQVIFFYMLFLEICL